MVNQAEALLALRAPDADWLATLITAMDQAQHDPNFSPRLAEVFAELAQQAANSGGLSPAIVEAAHRRTQEFNQRMAAELDMELDAVAPVERPELTLVGS